MREFSDDRDGKAGLPGILVHFLDVGKSGAIGKIRDAWSRDEFRDASVKDQTTLTVRRNLKQQICG